MKLGVEIDMVVSDSRAALRLYEAVFGAEVVEATSYEKGLNEAVFNIMGTRFHLLDENPQYSLYALKADSSRSSWCNLLVADIKDVFQKADAAGFEVIQGLTEMKDFGIINAIIKDPFAYVWMLHQIVKEVSFEERCKMIEKRMGIS